MWQDMGGHGVESREGSCQRESIGLLILGSRATREDPDPDTLTLLRIRNLDNLTWFGIVLAVYLVNLMAYLVIIMSSIDYSYS